MNCNRNVDYGGEEKGQEGYVSLYQEGGQAPPATDYPKTAQFPLIRHYGCLGGVQEGGSTGSELMHCMTTKFPEKSRTGKVEIVRNYGSYSY